MEKIELYTQSTMDVCKEFKQDGKKQEVTVVISPLRAEVSSDSSQVKIVMGCNMWQACENANCFFSKKARVAPKVAKKRAG